MQLVISINNIFFSLPTFSNSIEPAKYDVGDVFGPSVRALLFDGYIRRWVVAFHSECIQRVRVLAEFLSVDVSFHILLGGCYLFIRQH